MKELNEEEKNKIKYNKESSHIHIKPSLLSHTNTTRIYTYTFFRWFESVSGDFFLWLENYEKTFICNLSAD